MTCDLRVKLACVTRVSVKFSNPNVYYFILPIRTARLIVIFTPIICYIPELNFSTANHESTHTLKKISTNDENFNSLELHAMYDLSSWKNAAVCFSVDERVPCNALQPPQDYHAVLQLNTNRNRTAFRNNDATFGSEVSTVASGRQYDQTVSCSSSQIVPNCQVVLQHTDTIGNTTALTDNGAVTFVGKRRNIAIDQQYNQAEKCNTIDKVGNALVVERVDSHFETLGNLF